jgi:hypothetical protein
MACDYQAIRRDNVRRYGTDIGRIGPMLLADRYDDRTHFIYELLQNAEDALAKRRPWSGRRSVGFLLRPSDLRVSHFGKSFDEADVRGICGIAESTKDLTAIGRFGIGFKSVYAFTDRPEVHSGDESFAIESFVWPVVAERIARGPDETLMVLPLRDCSEQTEIEVGLKRLGATSLLFLRAIDEIEWSVEGGPSGLYLRSRPERLAESVRRVSVIGQSAGSSDVEETWLLFSKRICTLEGEEAGYIEVAFSVVDETKSVPETLRPVPRSPLVVFFPTVLETHLGFLVQGPYRTTPSRDNVPAQDAWNRQCVAETAAVLREALPWLRNNGFLNVEALRCLPLDRSKFPVGSMFAPIFQEVVNALSEEALLPRHGGGHVAAKQARLARSQELRDLLSPAQLTKLMGAQIELAWLSADISPDRTPELRDYLINELKIEEMRPEAILPKLTTTFLEAQPDAWIRRLYEFLGDQKALLGRVRDLPLVRLTDGKQVRPVVNGQPQAYLPGAVTTGFPTVRDVVCDTAEARAFLETLGLAEPDLVDDVITNVLPRYIGDTLDASQQSYAADIERVLRAFRTDSESRRNRLLTALRDRRFVAAREQSNDSPQMARPGDVYLATERLAELFAGVKDVLIVDNGHACLRGEDVRTLLVSCGSHRYLEPVAVETHLTWEQRSTIRRSAGLERASWERPIADATLRGLNELLRLMPRLDPNARQARALLLWEALSDLESRQGSGAFLGTYTWGYFHESKTAGFDAAFVTLLNEEEWVPDPDGNLCRSAALLFDSLGWKPNPFLLSKIRFKPPLIDQLAREAGIEPGVLDLLKRLGVTSEAELRERLGVSDDSRPDDGGVDDALGKLGITGTPTPPAPDPTAGDPTSSGARGGAGGGSHGTGVGNSRRTPSSGGTKPFISYVATQTDDEGPDPDGLDQTARIALEAKAIDLILSREPDWRRTPTHNPGFDLFEAGSDGQSIRWCEVKAMTGCLEDRPVGLSRTQFECARERAGAYWLYAVERAGTENARIVRIQDPAGKARTFTFDRGWLGVAEVDPESQEPED